MRTIHWSRSLKFRSIGYEWQRGPLSYRFSKRAFLETFKTNNGGGAMTVSKYLVSDSLSRLDLDTH